MNSSSFSSKKRVSIVGEKNMAGKDKIFESEEVKTQSSGAKVIKKRIVKTLAPRGHEKSTPWGVTLKPVPRKAVSEETVKTETEKKKVPKIESPKGSLPEKSKQNKSNFVKPDTVTRNETTITETVEIKVSLLSFHPFLETLFAIFIKYIFPQTEEKKPTIEMVCT